MTSQNLVGTLQMQPHPEGGYFKETYKSAQTIDTGPGERPVCTCIYYLLERNDRSHFHRLQFDELWFFHQGQPLQIDCIQNGQLVSITLGNDVQKGEMPCAKVPANTWFGAKIKNGEGYTLVSCTMSPGFDYADFELADREALATRYPQLRNVIEAYTR
jgi:uncharacterized protein